MPEDRRLAAIMFTDIVGYTKLMGEDEEKAFKVLRKNREIQRPIIKKYRGEWLKEMGDGILASFNTASDAVRCAGEIQKTAKKEGIALRIGIHSGEVVFEGHDVLGDGVNVASRLQELAEEGCINISGTIYKDIKNKAGIKTKYIGEKKLKNVVDPLKIYEVLCEKEEQRPQENKPLKRKTKIMYYLLGGIIVILMAVFIWKIMPINNAGSQMSDVIMEEADKSIAVLPFKNDSPDPDNEYFCNGMMEAILNHLVKVGDLNVMSRMDVEPYRNTTKTRKEIASELGVANLLEGSVTKIGNRFRIFVQLINPETGFHLWSEDFEGDYTEEIFSVQSNIAKQVAYSLKATIKPDEERRIDKYPNTNIEAYDYLLNAQELINKYWLTRNGDYSSSIHFFVDKALEIDPESPGVNLGKANAFLIDCTEDAQHLKVPNWDSIHYYADIALQLDPEYAEAYGMKGNVYDEQGMNDKAIEYLSKAIDLSPNDRELNLKLAEILNGSEKTQIDLIRGMTYLRKTIGTYNDSDPNKAYQIAAYYDFLDEFSKAEKHYLKSMKLGMTLPSYRAYSAFLILHGKPWEAIWFIDSVYMDQTDRTSLTRRIWGYIEINEFEKAERYYEKILDGGFRIFRGDSIRLGYMYLETNREAHAKSILSTIREQIEIRLSDRKHFWDLYNLCMIHAILNEAKEALRYLSEIEEFYVLMNYQKYIESSIVFSNIRNTPEFRAIMERSKAKNEATRAQIKEMEKREGFDM